MARSRARLLWGCRGLLAAGLFRVGASVQCCAFGGLGIAVVLLGGLWGPGGVRYLRWATVLTIRLVSWGFGWISSIE